MVASSTRLRVRPWWLPRIDVRYVVALLIVPVVLVAAARLIESYDHRAPVVVAARTLPPGHTITREDLTITTARLDGALGSLAMPETALHSLVGQTTAQTVHAGALVIEPDLGSGPLLAPGEIAVTVAVDADSVFARLRRGDQVGVLATLEPGRPDSETSVLLERTTVFEVSADTRRVALGARPGEDDVRLANVTVVVPQGEAERVVHALVNGRLTLVLVP